MSVKAVIFDFNGVLVWDSHLHEQVWKNMSLKYRKIPLTQEELEIHFHGRTNKLCFEYLLNRKIEDNEIGKLINERESMYRSLCLDMGSDFKLSPGSIELLELLTENKIPFTIATSSETTNVKFFFEQLSLSKWFVFSSITYDDGSLPSKPNPDIYLKAAKTLEFKPKDCMVIEDAKSGIEAARRAGVENIVALGPERTHRALKVLPGVTQVVSRLDELIPQFN